MREEMFTISKLDNVNGLLGMVQYVEKMKPKSIIALYVKICDVSS
jgi:hypothetical protein